MPQEVPLHSSVMFLYFVPWCTYYNRDNDDIVNCITDFTFTASFQFFV